MVFGLLKTGDAGKRGGGQGGCDEGVVSSMLGNDLALDYFFLFIVKLDYAVSCAPPRA